VTFEELCSKFRVGETYIYTFYDGTGIVRVKTTNPLTLVFPDSYEENKTSACGLVESSGYMWSPNESSHSSLLKCLYHPHKQPYKIYYRKFTNIKKGDQENQCRI